jgi:hypothetical protein
VFEVTDADVEIFEFEALEPAALFCRLNAPSLADSDGLSVFDPICDFGVSGISSASWSTFGDETSTLVDSETGSFDAFVFTGSSCVSTGISCAWLSLFKLVIAVPVGAAPLFATGDARVVDLGIT